MADEHPHIREALDAEGNVSIELVSLVISEFSSALSQVPASQVYYYDHHRKTTSWDRDELIVASAEAAGEENHLGTVAEAEDEESAEDENEGKLSLLENPVAVRSGVTCRRPSPRCGVDRIGLWRIWGQCRRSRRPRLEREPAERESSGFAKQV